ncbi:MAG: GYF domain-containing protein [Polyangiaceae bacterium]
MVQSPAPARSSLRAVTEPEAPESLEAESIHGDDRASGVGSSPSSAPASGAAPASAGYGSYTEDEDEATVVASVGLAAALSRAMDEDPAPSSMLASADGDPEWYVGVAGAPEGPLTVPQLKERIAAGSVELETLVWKDGFDDWRPLSQFPELAAVVEEFRPSKPLFAPTPSPAPAPTAAFHDADDDLGFGAVGFGQPRIGPNAASRPMQQDPSPVPPAPITGSEGIVTETRPSEIPLGLPKKHHNPAWQWLAVVAALGLGVTIGVVVWGGKKPQAIVKYVEVPVGNSATATQPAPTTDEPEKLENTEVPGDPKAQDGSGKVAAKGGQTAPPTSTAASKGGLDFGDGPKGPAGPNGANGAGTGSSGAGSQLDSSQVQRVVSSHTGSVKRSCWQPALSTRDSDAPSSARVSVTIKVAPSGSVSSVSTSGDPKGYRGLAGCIASRVRSWQFPAAGGPTTVNVPFVFAAQ